MKINYDRDNEQQHQIMEDYYFLKNFIKCLKDEWRPYFDKYFNKFKKYEYEKKAIHIIINHQNKYLLKHFVKIFNYYFEYEHLYELYGEDYLNEYVIRYCLLHINPRNERKIIDKLKELIYSNNYENYFLQIK
jgi:hypothetical protein